MKIDKTILLNKLHEKEYIRKLHRSIKEGLIGSLKNEYLLKKPMDYPYEQYSKETNTFIGLPILHAMIDMLTASFIHSATEKLLEEILDTIEEIAQWTKPSAQS